MKKLSVPRGTYFSEKFLFFLIKGFCLYHKACINNSRPITSSQLLDFPIYSFVDPLFFCQLERVCTPNMECYYSSHITNILSTYIVHSNFIKPAYNLVLILFNNLFYSQISYIQELTTEILFLPSYIFFY